jgi:hypothetical protein
MEMMIWNIVLTGIVGVLAFMVKGKFDELARLGVLLNRTREEMARDHITRAEMNNVVERLGDRFDRAVERLESKLDDVRKG